MAGVVELTVTEIGRLAMRFVLAATFLVAGFAKLADPQESVQTLRAFGVPPPLQPLGAFLGPLEIAVAAGLMFAVSAWYAAWGAAGLLVLFIAGIAVNLARGQQPACNCFGQLHSKPISWRTLVRNGVLAACAAWLVASGPPQAAADLWGFLTRLDSHGRRVAAVVAVVIGVALWHAVQPEEPDTASFFDDEPSSPDPDSWGIETVDQPQQPPAVRQAPRKVIAGDGLPINTPAPAFVMTDLAGQEQSLDSLLAPGQPVVLLFSSPSCESCQALVPKLPGLAGQYRQAFRLVLVSRGSVQQNLEKLKDPGQLLVLRQREYEVAQAYDCGSTPAAVVIGADGTIQSQLAVGAPAIEQLLASHSES